MKTKKVYFSGFWSDFNCEDNMFVNILRKNFNVIVDSQDPDFLICSPLGTPYEYMKYDCPRIMYTGEFISADFTAFDYFIGYDDIQFGDRAFRFPLFLYSAQGLDALPQKGLLTEDEAVKELKSKEFFCNYIFGHDTQLGIREKILEQLSAYKRVECAGTHRNNMPGNKTFNMATKHAFMSKCKFSIAAESVCYPGFTSEKIGHAFRDRTIPIYYGDPNVTKVFNPEAFVDCYSYPSIEAAIAKVIEIDQNDDMYIHMLCAETYLNAEYEAEMYKKLEAFLCHIFMQDREEAYRRPRFYRSKEHENNLKMLNKLQTSFSGRVIRKLGL